jgi:hypothetical protein
MRKAEGLKVEFVAVGSAFSIQHSAFSIQHSVYLPTARRFASVVGSPAAMMRRCAASTA